MGDAAFPFERAHRHVFDHGAAAGLQAVVAGEKHPQPPAVGREELHGKGRGAVVALPHEAAVRPAKRNGGVDAVRDAGAFENDIGAGRRDLFDLCGHVLDGAVDRVIRAHLPRNGQRGVVDVHGHDHTPPVRAGGHHAQPDETGAMDDHGLSHLRIGHVHAIQPHGGHDEHAGRIHSRARDEMRHYNWLAQAVVRLGGTPTLERGRMRTGGDGVSAWLQNDVRQEGDAIKLYREHIELINDPGIKRLLEHILGDEISHQESFRDFADEADDEGLKDIRGMRIDETAKVINWGIAHEYTVILQYLFHSYLAPHPEIKRQLADQAINEMQHLGWLAEGLASDHGTPVIEHTAVDQSVDQKEMLRADIKIEKEVSARYRAAADNLLEPDLKKLLRRIADQEDYHAAVFEDLLDNEAA